MARKKKSVESKESWDPKKWVQPPSIPYERIEELPEWKVGEIVGGELHVSPRPLFGHCLGNYVLGGKLMEPFQYGNGGPGGWWFVPEPELHLGRDIVIPDLAGWRRERMPVFPARIPFHTLAPDWICEVLSPSTEKLDREKKMKIYEREYVSYLWLLDPIKRTLETFRLEGSKWRTLETYCGDAIIRAEPFEAIEIDLLNIWGETRKAAPNSTVTPRPPAHAQKTSAAPGPRPFAQRTRAPSRKTR